MPVLQALSSPSIACQALARLVAFSTTFQSVVSVASAAEAYEHVYWPEANDYDPEDPNAPVDPWPRAICTTLEWGMATQGQGYWLDSGALGLSFEFVIPEEYTGRRRDEQLWFENQWGQIAREMFDARGQHDTAGNAMLYFNSMRTLGPPGPAQRSKELGFYYGVALAVTWPN